MKKLLAAILLMSGIGLFAVSSTSSAATLPLPDGAEMLGSDKDCSQACTTCQKACSNVPDSAHASCLTACSTAASACCTALGKKAPGPAMCDCQ